jgi:hypothetical protein
MFKIKTKDRNEIWPYVRYQPFWENSEVQSELYMQHNQYVLKLNSFENFQSRFPEPNTSKIQSVLLELKNIQTLPPNYPVSL